MTATKTLFAIALACGAGSAFAQTEAATPLPGFAAMAVRMADAGSESESDAVTGATPEGNPPLEASLFGWPVSVGAHRVMGYSAGALLLAGGIAGGLRFYDMMERAHEYRDANGIDEIEPECSGIITDAWEANQGLRWAHIALTAAGETLYLADAATGIGMIGKATPSRAGTIHRNAFFVHAGLMAADAALGFILMNALRRGDHRAVEVIGGAHMALGFAIPVVIIGSGLAIDYLPETGP